MTASVVDRTDLAAVLAAYDALEEKYSEALDRLETIDNERGAVQLELNELADLHEKLEERATAVVDGERNALADLADHLLIRQPIERTAGAPRPLWDPLAPQLGPWKRHGTWP